MEIYTLTDEKRQRILSKLKYKQIKILSDFTMYKAKSEMITKDFVIANDWKLADIREDAFWNLRSMDNNQVKNIPKLKCECGKNLRYQYILRSSSGKELKLGVTHFAQHAGIRCGNDLSVNDLSPESQRLFFALLFLSSDVGDNIVFHFRPVLKGLARA